jgi:hypothetical protein
MTNSYNVHIYREMRLVFGGIEADSHEAAAAIARDRPTGDADSIDDCEGETIAALVDVQGDEEYEQSRLIDFEEERLRKAAPSILAALEDLMHQLTGIGIAAESGDDPELDFGQWAGTEGLSFANARAAIAAAKTAGIPPDPVPNTRPARFEIEHDPAGNSDRISVTRLLVPAGASLIAGKLYLHLYHGRKDPAGDMQDWGFDGPTFGPLTHAVHTYIATIRLYGDDVSDELWLDAYQDMIVWDGAYYGDMSIFIATGAEHG